MKLTRLTGCFSTLVLLLSISPIVYAQNSQIDSAQESPAREDVEKLIKQSGANVSVAFRSLDNTGELFIQADAPFEDSIAMKIPVMIELYAQVQARELTLADPLPVHNGFHSAADDTTYDLDLASDSLKSSPRTMTLAQLCNAMIVNNSSLAANLLIEKLGLAAINQRISALGADGMILASGFADAKAAAKGMKNVTSARALMTVLRALAANQVVTADASQEMIGLIAHSGLSGDITQAMSTQPAVAPRPLGTPTVGERHDAAIIFGAHSFVLVTDVRGLDDAQAAVVVAQITHALSSAM